VGHSPRRDLAPVNAHLSREVRKQYVHDLPRPLGVCGAAPCRQGRSHADDASERPRVARFGSQARPAQPTWWIKHAATRLRQASQRARSDEPFLRGAGEVDRRRAHTRVGQGVGQAPTQPYRALPRAVSTTPADSIKPAEQHAGLLQAHVEKLRRRPFREVAGRSGVLQTRPSLHPQQERSAHSRPLRTTDALRARDAQRRAPQGVPERSA